MSSTPTFDMQLAMARAGNNRSLAHDLYKMYCEELPGYLQQIQQFGTDSDLALFTEEIHRMLGGARYCGFASLQQQITLCYEALKNNDMDRFQQNRTKLIEETKLVLTLPFPF